jgi:hypothetical protein
MDPKTLPDPKEAIGISEVGGEEFSLLQSLHWTLLGVARSPERIVIAAFRGLVPDAPHGVGLERALPIVQGQVQIDWYQAKGKEVPRRCVVNQEARLNEGKAQPEVAVDEEGKPQRSKPGLKVKDIICEGLLAGRKDEDILEAVREKFADSKATKKDIGYYRHKLRNEGRLERHVPKNSKKKPTADSSNYVPSGAALAAPEPIVEKKPKPVRRKRQGAK